MQSPKDTKPTQKRNEKDQISKEPRKVTKPGDEISEKDLNLVAGGGGGQWSG